MWQVFSWKWMRWLKSGTGVSTKGGLYLHPAPLCRLPAAAPPKQGCQCGFPGVIVEWSRMTTQGTVMLGCRRVSFLRLVSMRSSSVPARLPSLWCLWPVPSWPPPGRRAMWWNKVTWGSWSGATEDILSWELEVTLGRADWSGTRTRRSSQHWRSLLVKLRCLGRASKG